jgi:hypothetical protein
MELPLKAFPAPDNLRAKYRTWKGLAPEQEEVFLQDFFEDRGGKEPRYYQRIAINRAIEAISKGQNRILLVMATGTGKPYTAFQFIWRLWKGGRKKRILFLADRNVLVDQTMVNDFRPFGAAMAKLSTGSKTIEREDGTEVRLPTAVHKKYRRILNSDDCHEIKSKLERAAIQARLITKSSAGSIPRFQVLNRLAIEELEAWFFGDIQALHTAYPRISLGLGNRARYQDSDAIIGGTWEALARELKRAGYFPGGFSQITAAREISKFMAPERNRSKSFQVFRQGLIEMTRQEI